MTAPDFRQDADAASVDPAAYAEAVRAAKRLLDAEVSVAQLEAELATAKAHRHRLATHVVPLAFRAAGIDALEGRGATVTVREVVSCAVRPEHRAEAVRHLLQTGGTTAVRRAVVATLPPDLASSDAIEQVLASLVGPDAVAVEERLHGSALKAWARQQLAAGAEVPAALFTCYAGLAAEVKAARPSSQPTARHPHE